MGHERDEQVIFVKDLLFAALYQWRRILIAALAFAVLIGGIVGISQWRSASASPSEELVQEELAKYETQKLLLEKAVADAENLVESQEQYNTNSAIMALDPYNIYKATIELTVQTDYQILPEMSYQNPDYTGAFLHAYAVYLGGDQIIQTAAQAMNTENKYMRELITFTDGGSETRSLSISIIYTSAEGAQKILDIFLGSLGQAKEQICQSIGEHSVNVIASSVDECIDLTITEKQAAAQTRLEDLRVSLEDAQAQLSALQAPVFGTTASIRKALIFFILGGIAGAGLIACAAWFTHIAGGKVYSARTLTNKTGLRILGCVPGKEHRNPVDRWLRKLEGRCLCKEQLSVVAAAVRSYCKDTKQLLIVGDCSPSDQELIAQAIQFSGVQVRVCGSLLRSAEAHDALRECDTVLLVEKCGCSRYHNVQQTIERISDQSKQLIGCILLEG